jgi:sulfate transport system substrate-binding protein
MSLGLFSPETLPSSAELQLLNVSYDPTREFFTAYNAKFAEHYRALTGQTVKISQSHGGSSKQARSVIEGLRADVVTLALAYDIQVIADHHMIKPDWMSRMQWDASPYTSTVMFLVRKGNPRQIRDWDDLVRSGVKVITPNPKTSGGARWNFLAAWGYVTIAQGASDAAAAEFMAKLYRNVPVLDSGARGATTTFVQRKIGDVFVTWENEALLARNEYGSDALQMVYPSVSILTQPCVAVVDRNVDRRGPSVRAAAEEYLKYLCTDTMQELIAQHGYRPANPAILAKYRQRYPALKLFTLKQVTGNWGAAQRRFFSEDGVFDQIYQGGGNVERVSQVFPERGFQFASWLAGACGNGINSALLSSDKPEMQPSAEVRRRAAIARHEHGIAGGPALTD